LGTPMPGDMSRTVAAAALNRRTAPVMLPTRLLVFFWKVWARAEGRPT
jgi:hypothetical protein